jgi:hypothetical protein
VECGLYDLRSNHFFRTSQGNLTTVLRYLNNLGNKSSELLLGYIALLGGCYESYLGMSVLSINSPLIEKCGVYELYLPKIGGPSRFK